MAGCKEACFVFQRLSCTVKQFLQSHCSVCLKWALFCHNIFFQCRLFVSLVNLCETSCFKHLFKGVGWLDRFCECAQISHLSNPCISARLCESPGYAQYYNSFLKPAIWNVYLKPSNCLNTTAGLPLSLLSFLSEHPIHGYATSDAWPVWPRRRHLQPWPKRLQYFSSPDTSCALSFICCCQLNPLNSVSCSQSKRACLNNTAGLRCVRWQSV